MQILSISKKLFSQNMFTVYDLEIKFIYRLICCKRSAYDQKVLSDAIKTKKYCIFIDKYFLGDIRYLNLDYFLVFYKRF